MVLGLFLGLAGGKSFGVALIPLAVTLVHSSSPISAGLLLASPRHHLFSLKENAKATTSKSNKSKQQVTHEATRSSQFPDEIKHGSAAADPFGRYGANLPADANT